MQRTAFIYCRISDDKTGAKLGVQRQEEDCRALAADRGYEVVRVFQDNDMSAYSGKARPEYAAMLKRVTAGEVDAVLCWHPDRLHRRPVELEAYIDACREGGAVTHTVKAGEMDLATDSGQMIARMLGAAARYESDIKATRIRRASEQAIRAGKWTGGTRPFGWTISDGIPELHQQESKALAEACTRVLKGDSLGSIIRDLNEQGLKTTRGKEWGYPQLAKALQRPRNAGLADYHGEIVGPSTFPAIVSENVWRGVCAVLSDPSRRRSQSNKAVHLLAGIAQCHCGAYVRSATVSGRDGQKHRIYRCVVRGPGHVSKRIEFVDHVVNTVIIAVRSAHAAAKGTDAGPDPEAERLQMEATALRKRQDEAGTQAALGKIPMQMLSNINAVIEKELAVVTAAMIRIEEAAVRRPPTDEDFRSVSMTSTEAAEWLSMHIDDRRDYLRSICNVLLLPHGKGSTKVFNPDTVQVVIKAPGEGPGPLAQREIERQTRQAEALRGQGAGAFMTFHVGGEATAYRIQEDADGAADHESEPHAQWIPLQ
ncbi:recombinase family protein [Arthrobacter gandavensis]|uniref:recombinase family protein n=1 Tax=Arthrobacter gandavensis TaxID=169960 RepID=UPI00188EB0BD|nr:recombinase family protein [Arthrobacter gandavensis]MBF4993650.1 recombinase family protein [Arthrobacter gandavensis]